MQVVKYWFVIITLLKKPYCPNPKPNTFQILSLLYEVTGGMRKGNYKCTLFKTKFIVFFPFLYSMVYLLSAFSFKLEGLKITLNFAGIAFKILYSPAVLHFSHCINSIVTGLTLSFSSTYPQASSVYTFLSQVLRRSFT